MTENECVETLQYLLGYENAVDKGELESPNNLNSQEKEALQMIIEEIQQYKAIGTVEGYENAIKAYTETYILMKEYKSKLKDFEAIGTIEEFKALKEKSVAKKLIDKIIYLECPDCGNLVAEDSYCQCGQYVK